MQTFNTEKETQDEPARSNDPSPGAGFRAHRSGGRNPRRRVALYGILGVLFIVIVGGFLVSRSVPGDALYGMKVRFFEDTIGGLTTGPAAEQVSRMQSRLEELKKLHAESALTTESLRSITQSTHEHATTFKGLVTEEGSSVTSDDALMHVSDMTSIVRSQERIIKFGNNQDAIRDIERTREYITDLRDDLIVRLAAEGDGTRARDFIADRLDVLSEALDSGELTRARIAVTEDYVQEVAESLIAGDLAGALEAVTKAEELIELDRYIRDVSEDPTVRG